MVLKMGGWNLGVKPFHFNNCWLENRNFKGVVERGDVLREGDGWVFC
jgi:hypothetical protein